MSLPQASLTVTRWLLKTGQTDVSVGPGNPETWLPLKDVSLFFVYGLLAAEDSRFFQHSGLDIEEIKASFWLNQKSGRIVRGASTISQQVVKMIFLSQEKTWRRKIYEVSEAVVLEKLLSKEDILTWYINLLPLGEGIYGVKDAAWVYFQTQPEFLTLVQSIQLATLIPSPNVRSKMFKDKQMDDGQKKRFLAILQEMFNNGYITKVQYAEALAVGNFGHSVLTDE